MHRMSSQSIKNTKKIEDQEKKHEDEVRKLRDNVAKERSSLREQYLSDQEAITKQLKNDVDEQNRIYKDALKSRTAAIYNYYSLFASVERDERVSGTKLLKNLRDQKEAYEDWQKSLSALSARGVSDGLMDELQEMGVASKGQIKALLGLSDVQLMEYMSLYRNKNEFARKQAESELEDLQKKHTKGYHISSKRGRF